MKNLIFTLVLFLTCYGLSAQVLNNNIRYGGQATIGSVNYNGDDPVGNSEYTFLAQITDIAGVAAAEFPCLTFEAPGAVPGYPFILTFSSIATDRPYEEWVYLKLTAWEDDIDPRCEYNSGDDRYEETLTPVWANCLPCLGPPSEWLNTASASSSCTGGAFTTPASDYGFCYSLLWQYEHGDTKDSPLEFGNINWQGQKVNLNSNRTASIPQLSYSNTEGFASPDVFYKFTINERSDVLITTDREATDFDTYLVLSDIFGNTLAENDDISSTNRRSRIEATLCPGDYFVRVEGYQNENGIFELAVEASALPVISLDIQSGSASCDNIPDGSIFMEMSGGILPPYSFRLNDETVDSDSPSYIFEGLSAGTYIVLALDGCGTVAPFQNIDVVIDDQVAPIAICAQPDSFSVDFSSSAEPYTFTSSDALAIALNHGSPSYDACSSITDAELFPSQITIEDAPSLQVVVTVFDEANNSAQCITSVGVELPTSARPDEALDAAIELFPNPVADVLQIKATGLQLEGGQLQLHNAQGQLILQQAAPAGAEWLHPIDMSALPAGLYTLRISGREGQVTRKLIRK